MAEIIAPSRRRIPAGLAVSIAGLLILAAALTASLWSAIAPPRAWLQAVVAPDRSLLADVLIHEAALPRIVVALLSGGALALSGTVFQHVLRNPLAEPGTLGVAAGAYLAIAAASLWLPDLWLGRSSLALIGGLTALVAVLALAGPGFLSPTRAIVAGLLVTQICAAIGTAITLFQEQASTGLMIWASGSLEQQGWATATRLAAQSIPAAALILILIRPMTLLGLDETHVRGLGVRAGRLRLMLLPLAVALSAFVVSAAGIIGFIGLAAPAMAHALGARRLRDRLLWAPLLGAALLWFTDAGVQVLQPELGHVPAGAAAALFGAPLMVWLVPRMRHGLEPAASWPGRLRRPAGMLMLLLAALGLAMVFSLLIGRNREGLDLRTWSTMQPFLVWRAPRMVASLSAGAMLGLSGAMLQRLTGNAMASPELLGVSSGAMLGLIASVVLVTGGTAATQTAAAAAGAAMTLAAVMILSLRTRFAPSQVLLVGLGLTAGTTALVGLWMGLGDPRAYLALKWLSGSTDAATPRTAGIASAAALACLVAATAMIRPLAILPLGVEVSIGTGVRLAAARAAILLVTAIATGFTATIVGPLSFIGLLAPSQARLLGFATPLSHLLGAAVIGALVMVVADWLSRIILFPYSFPAGLLGSLIAAPVIIVLLRRP